MRGLVTNKNADLFTVESGEQTIQLKSRGTCHRSGVYVGDQVEFDAAISNVLPRRNLLIRPPLANVDKIFIVVSPLPEPDFLLVDKMILCCFAKGITPVLVINKEDVCDQKFVQFVKSTYKNVCKITICSAKTGKIDDLKKQISGICAFAGQSAVGKSSLINALLQSRVSQTGDLSKIERGKQTTRMVTLFKTAGGYIADTAGFSSLEVGILVDDLSPQEVARFYPDFLPYLGGCKYRSCTHRQSDQATCGIIENVKNGKISQSRYKNYIKIIDSLATFKPKYNKG